LIATGSEVQLALAAREELGAQDVRARVVSLPCWNLIVMREYGLDVDHVTRQALARIEQQKKPRSSPSEVKCRWPVRARLTSLRLQPL
jgi:transketolase